MRNDYINPFQVECNLTTLCLQYLTFPSSISETSDAELKTLVKDGQLAFHEYAIANWFVHFLELASAGMQAIESEKTNKGTDQNSLRSRHAYDLAEFEGAYEDFAELHLLDEQELREEELVDAARACIAFSESGYHEDFQRLWALSKNHADAALDIRNKPCLPSLEEALKRGRKIIEDMSTVSKGDAPALSGLDQYYGETRFKCPKVTCHWFHVGFNKSKIRNDHVARHERPFRCEVTDCSAGDIGFKASKQLEKHMRMFHPTLRERAESFNTLRVAPTKTPFACHLCEKRFTRRFHLTSHIRNHNQEKPFACTQCGREFTRANDCKRHEKIITLDELEYYKAEVSRTVVRR